jgi:hypothetical protein
MAQSYNGTFLSPDETDRFINARFCLGVERTDSENALFDLREGNVFTPWLTDPFEDLNDYVSRTGDADFTRQLLEATLAIYHESREWLIIFYSVALFNSVESCEAALDYLIHSPPDMTAFILKAIRGMEDEMTEQIAANYAYTPYALTDLATTRQFFAHLYADVRPRLTAIRNGVQRRRLLL